MKMKRPILSSGDGWDLAVPCKSVAMLRPISIRPVNILNAVIRSTRSRHRYKE